MINPKKRTAITKCRPSCKSSKLCAACMNFRKSFKVGDIVTWGSCKLGFKITQITRDGIVCDRWAVDWHDLNLSKVNKIGSLKG